VQRCGLSGTFVLISDMTALCHVSLTARLSFVRAYAALLPGDIALSHRHSTSYCYLHSAPLCISCSLHCSQLHISCISVTRFESRCYQLCNSYTSDRCIGLRCSQLSDTSSGTAIQLCTLCLAVRRIALHYPLRCVSQESVTRIALRYSLRCVSQESVTRIALRYSLSDVSIHSSHSSLPRRKNCPMPRAALLAACCIEGDSQTYPFAAPAAFCVAGNCPMPRSELLAALCVAGNCILQRSAPSTGLHTMEAVTRSTWQGDCRRVATACAHTTSLRSFSRCEAATCVCSSWVTHSGRTAALQRHS